MSNDFRLSTIPFYYVSSFRQSLAAGESCPFHCHHEIEVVYHPTGEGWTKSRDGVMHKFKSGALVVYQPKVFHTQQMTVAGEDYCLIAGIADNEMLFKNPVSVWDKISNPYIIQEIHSLSDVPMQHGREQVLNLRISALLTAIVSEWEHIEPKRNIGSGERYACEARRLCENVSQFRTVAKIAEEINISPDYLRHIFYDTFGCSLKSSIDALRIKRAKELLIHSTMPQKMIAEQSGFSHESYFCTAFKKATHTTPGAFRHGTLKEA